MYITLTLHASKFGEKIVSLINLKTLLRETEREKKAKYMKKLEEILCAFCIRTRIMNLRFGI